MSKSAKIYAAAGIIIILIIFLLFILIRNSNSPAAPQSTGPAAPAPSFPIPSPSDKKMPVKIKDGSTVNVSNIYSNPVEKLSQNGVAFRENADYSMAFYPNDQSFIVTILNPDIQTARDKAESDILQALGVDKNTACQLNISLSVPYDVNATASGQEYAPSFCPNGKPFPKQ
jgi:hypothetical protein